MTGERNASSVGPVAETSDNPGDGLIEQQVGVLTHSPAQAVKPESRCDFCGRPAGRALYEVRTGAGTAIHCLWCALRHGNLVRRSLTVAIVVGTALVAINQGNLIVQGDATVALAWKVPLTYVVPYCVSTFGSIMNARRRIGELRA